ncbi:MAG: ABC transporter permease subunit [Melioribacteraceae bacterium]|nr:ABC transporter permease subunit [Melioribacteraceae bacterium]MDD3558862.1 ABC transporter permease subunit [Melioribacteraceae bacterium]
MISLTLIELQKIFKKWRTYIGFIAIGVLVPIVQIALYFEGEDYLKFATQNLQNSFMFVGNLLNGYLIANIILQALFIHIPFLVVLVGGDLLAGEATGGTYRMLITRPISRFHIITSKFLAGAVYTNLLLLWLMILSLGVSILVFGTGPMIVLRDKVYIFAENDILWRFLMAYLFASVSLLSVFALSFFFSSMVENAIGPIVASMAVIIIFLIVSALPIEALKVIQPFLFTNYMVGWREFMVDPVNLSKIIESVLILFLHVFGFYLITLILFKRKDILS